jgi:long-chain acyl-CoA synthetase
MIVSGGHNCVGPWTEGKGVRMLAYLPTAHIYGFVFELCAQYWGATIGYARIRTLTDTSVKNCKGDLREFKPQFLTS